LAAATQLARSVSCSARQRAATRPSRCRTADCLDSGDKWGVFQRAS
jgi:hypothetical protein